MKLSDLKDNINRFSIPQMLSNNDGKTSASGTIGVIVSIAGVIAFLFGCIDFSLISGKNDIMMYAGGIITLGTGLLGARKYKDQKTTTDEAEQLSKINTNQ